MVPCLPFNVKFMIILSTILFCSCTPIRYSSWIAGEISTDYDPVKNINYTFIPVNINYADCLILFNHIAQAMQQNGYHYVETSDKADFALGVIYAPSDPLIFSDYQTETITNLRGQVVGYLSHRANSVGFINFLHLIAIEIISEKLNQKLWETTIKVESLNSDFYTLSLILSSAALNAMPVNTNNVRYIDVQLYNSKNGSEVYPTSKLNPYNRKLIYSIGHPKNTINYDLGRKACAK